MTLAEWENVALLKRIFRGKNVREWPSYLRRTTGTGPTRAPPPRHASAFRGSVIDVAALGGTWHLLVTRQRAIAQILISIVPRARALLRSKFRTVRVERVGAAGKKECSGSAKRKGERFHGAAETIRITGRRQRSHAKSSTFFNVRGSCRGSQSGARSRPNRSVLPHVCAQPAPSAHAGRRRPSVH